MRSRACSDLLALTLAFSGHTVVIDGPPKGIAVTWADVNLWRRLAAVASCT